MMTEKYTLLSDEDKEEEEDNTGHVHNRRYRQDIDQVLCVGGRMKKSSVLKVFLAVSVLVNLALIAFLLWTYVVPFTIGSSANVQEQQQGEKLAPPSTTITTTDPPTTKASVNNILHMTPFCEIGNITLKHPKYVNVFQDLSKKELMAAQAYILGVKEFGLKKYSSHLTDNFVYSIELQTPNKSAALNFLDNNGAKPVREARAVLFLPSRDPPVVDEYVIGPFPNPTYHYRNPRRNKPISYRVRQFNNVEMSHAMTAIQKAFGSKVEDFLKRQYGASLFHCYKECITFISSGVSSSFTKDRKLWIRLMHKVEFATLHPVGFQFLLNMRGLDSKKWFVEKVWYADRTYGSFDELVNKYERGDLPKLQLTFPKVPEGEDSLPGSLNIKGRQFPDVPQAPPKQYEPQGHRYTIKNQHVSYLQQWQFGYRMSYAGAIQLYDVRFGDDRIAYEISLQEVSVLYAGGNPATLHAQLADSAFGLSRNAHGLVPGVDCPDHATFLDVTLFGSDSSTPKVYPNSICVFEHANSVPARRHKAHSRRSGFYYHGLADNVLILRTVYVMYNYDYVLDFVFHQNGGLEVKVYSTGYILSAFYTEGEKPFGFEVFKNTVGSIHHHMFNFKLDLDILGTENRYETYDFVVDNVTRSWYDDGKPYPQLSYKKVLKKTEKDAAYKYNFDTPKYLIFNNNNKRNAFNEQRGYRLMGRGFAKQILPETNGALNSFTWSRYQMAVTKRRDTEETSSSMHAIFDDADPVVSLQRYLDDNENIVDQDLVAWVTLGMHHLPHTEDIPNTPTTGTEASITLLPYNYYQECPSMGARDALRVEGIPDLHFNYHGIPHDVTCVPKHFSHHHSSDIKRDIFMSLDNA